MTRAEFDARVREVADGWLGVPFLHNGRTKSQGVDCLGLVVCLLREAGVPDVPDGDGKVYAPDWYRHTPEARYLDGLLANGVPVDRAALRPGDVLFFRTGRFGRTPTDSVTHGGVSLGGEDFVHAITGRSVERGDLRKRAWMTTYAGAIRPYHVLTLLGEATP